MSEAARLLDRQAVLSGAAVALAVAVPTIVVGAAIDTGPGSNSVLVLYAIYLVGQVVGGRRAGRRCPDAPLANGSAAALATYLALAVVASVIRAVRGDPPNGIALLFNAFVAASAGILGGLLAAWSRREDDRGRR